MNWLYTYYFGEGPGVEKGGPKPEGLRLLASVLGREWWELLKLNLLFIAFSLPLVTLPAAYLAMTCICVMMIEDRNVYLWRDFQSAFRAGFGKAGLAGIALTSAGALAWFAASAYGAAAQTNLLFALPFAVAASICALLPLFGAYGFVALARADDAPLAGAARTAALAVLARPLPGIAAMAFTALLWLAHILFYPASALLPVLVNFSLGALVMAFAALASIQRAGSHTAASSRETTRRPKSQSA